MFTLQYHLTDEAVIHYNITHQYSTPILRRRVQAYRFGFGAAYAILAVVWIIIWHGQITGALFGFLFGGLACLFFFGTSWRMKRSLRRSIARMKAVGKLPYDVDTTETFDEDGIHSVSDSREAFSQYSTVERILIGDDAYYIYEAAANAHIVPYRAFASEEERAAFLAFIETKTGVKAVPGRTR